MSEFKLTLRSLNARAVLLPLKRPVVARIATIREWPIILIDIETEEGIKGRAYLEPYIPKSMKYLVPALQDLGEHFKGRQIVPSSMFEEARRSLQFVGYEGLAMIAVSGFDMAMWDTLARAVELPLCRLLGGECTPIKSYTSNGLWLNEPEAVADEAVELLEEGSFSGLKMRMGRENPRIDVAAFEAIRNRVGESISIMVDFNQSLNLADSITRCRMLDELGITWIEEPLQYDDFDGYKQLADQMKTPLQIGENFYGPRDMHRAIQLRICDLVMPDFMRIGGVTGWLRSVPIAAAAGIPVSTHLYPEVAAHVMTVTETAHWLEWQDWADPVLQEPYAIVNGDLQIPNKPGLGLDWNEDVVGQYLYNS